ncbi:MAG: AmmeMemoRadiSam system protein A [Candidatus Cloacimonetes bacterium]|nr:AmmeMemoRadiSam system protein A [Candidatus Cloacimonadota bacterium]
MLSTDAKKLVFLIVRQTIESRFDHRIKPLECPPDEVFSRSLGLFVTINKHNNLRGCVGYVKPYKPLYYALIDLASAAAFNDNRFNPVQESELKDLRFEISLLSPLISVKEIEEIVVGRDGLMIEHPWGSGLLLPQVAAKYNWTKEQFLKETCHKACLDANCWKQHNTKIYRFEAEIFSEDD